MEGPWERLNDAEVTKGDVLVTRYPIDVARFASRSALANARPRAEQEQSIPALVWCRGPFQQILNRHHEHRL